MPTDKSQAVRIEGYDDFKRELKAAGDKLPRELGQANKKASELVASDARQKAAALGGVAAKTAPSIKTSAAANAAKITLGGQGFPFAMGAEFGSIEFTQFKPWRGSGSQAGYFLWPAVRSTREEFIEVYGDMIDDLMRQAFPT